MTMSAISLIQGQGPHMGACSSQCSAIVLVFLYPIDHIHGYDKVGDDITLHD